MVWRLDIFCASRRIIGIAPSFRCWRIAARVARRGFTTSTERHQPCSRVRGDRGIIGALPGWYDARTARIVKSSAEPLSWWRFPARRGALSAPMAWPWQHKAAIMTVAFAHDLCCRFRGRRQRMDNGFAAHRAAHIGFAAQNDVAIGWRPQRAQ